MMEEKKIEYLFELFSPLALLLLLGNLRARCCNRIRLLPIASLLWILTLEDWSSENLDLDAELLNSLDASECEWMPVSVSIAADFFFYIPNFLNRSCPSNLPPSFYFDLNHPSFFWNPLPARAARVKELGKPVLVLIFSFGFRNPRNEIRLKGKDDVECVVLSIWETGNRFLGF